MSKQDFINIFANEIESNDSFGLLGFSIIEIDEGDNYKDIGKSLYNLIINATEEEYNIIEKTVCAISGWDFENLLEKMKRNSEYFDIL